MSSEFLNYTQTNSETSAISAEPSADPAHFKADALVVFLESDGLRGPLIEIVPTKYSSNDCNRDKCPR